jgi:signal peptide peptidase SppA
MTLLAIYREALARKAAGQEVRLSRQELEEAIKGGAYADLHGANPFHREFVSFGPSEPLEGARHTRIYQGGVAVIDVAGPIYRHASDASSGAVSTGRIARDLMLARKDDKVRSILFVIDSPGGEATGMDELAQKIFETRTIKPVESYIEGLGCSGAFYIASATQRITASKMALTGSIGVVMGVPAPKSETEKGQMVYEDHGDTIVEFKSSQSPNKRVNPLSEAGQDYYQKIVDETADVFVNDVARFRSLAPADVPKQYGEGGVSASASALSMGLIDAIGSFEEIHDRMARSFYESQGQPSSSTATSSGSAPEAQADGGDKVGRFAQGLKNAVSAVTGGGAKPDANAASSTTDDGQQRYTREELVAQMFKERQALEKTFESKALLAAAQLVTGSKVMPAIQEHIAFEFLTAMVDDSLLGGTVLFCVGEDEKEGTRVEQLRAKYEAIPAHTLADERVAAVKEGRIQGRVLNDGEREKIRTTEPSRSSREGESQYTDDELRSMTPEGQKVLAGQTNGNGTQARQ